MGEVAVLSRPGGALLWALAPCFVVGLVDTGRRLEGGAALSAPAASHALQGLLSVLPLLGTCVVSAIVVSLLFARLARRPVMEGAGTSAALFVLTLPASTPVVPAAVCMVFGLVVGREVFGTLDRTFVHPAVLGHVFLGLAWPAALAGAAPWLPSTIAADPSGAVWFVLSPAPGALGAASALACLAGAALLTTRRLVAWQVVAAVPVGVAVALALLGRSDGLGPSMAGLPGHFAVGRLVFGAAFLAGAPRSSPVTTSGQWFHGALVGFLVVLFRQTISTGPDGTMNALLLASVFAPLADHIVRALRPAAAGARHA